MNEPKKRKGFTLWLTGLSGSGKTTIAERVSLKLERRGIPVEFLDGDAAQNHLLKGLGHSQEDLVEGIKRVGYVCQLLTRQGVAAIASIHSPYRDARNFIRKEIKDFVEVYTRCPVEVCAQRDLKGLYQKAHMDETRDSKVKEDPYEPPLNPELVCKTDAETVEESIEKVIKKLEELGYLPQENP